MWCPIHKAFEECKEYKKWLFVCSNYATFKYKTSGEENMIQEWEDTSLMTPEEKKARKNEYSRLRMIKKRGVDPREITKYKKRVKI